MEPECSQKLVGSCCSFNNIASKDTLIRMKRNTGSIKAGYIVTFNDCVNAKNTCKTLNTHLKVSQNAFI